MALLIVAAGLLSPNTGLIFWMLLAFGTLLFLLTKFAWRPIVGALEEREHTIEESITRAERALAEAQRLQSDNEAARRQAEAQAQQILRDAREAADAIRADEIDKTRAQLAQMAAQAQAEIERQKAGAIQELRHEVSDLAIEAAERILRTSIDSAQQRQLVDQFIAEHQRN